MKLRWITYVCQLGHELQFGHLVRKNGKFDAPSPNVCSCGQSYVLALTRASSAPNAVPLV
jgi:hypothetical protein